MHPDLGSFFDRAFESVQPALPDVGRVVVEPDYDSSPADQDAAQLAAELTQLLREQSPEPTALASHDGFDVHIPDRYPIVAKYIRSITLHQDRAEGPWIEVAPPGNWI